MRIDYRIFEEITLAETGKYKIKLDNDNKGQDRMPHVHVELKGDRKASIAICDGSTLWGSVPRDIRRDLERWLASHRDELMGAWKLMERGVRPAEMEWGL